MKRPVNMLIPLSILFSVALLSGRCRMEKEGSRASDPSQQARIKLPPPLYKSQTSIEEALLQRRSIRNYKKEQLELRDISQILWAGQGITSENGGRTAPSAGAIYPLELYVLSGDIKDVPPGVYHYLPAEHSLDLVARGDLRNALSGAASMQGSVRRGAAVVVITANYQRITRKYKERGVRFAHLEAGHAAQNICLQAVSLGIGTVTVGAFTDSEVTQLLHLPPNEEPLYLMPLGKRK
ncbi:MAG: SagB/ThcOx family dehydrogenase [Bacteroidota bacterium]|nr:SagB/ThcOx family dehydrogenase [Bacteroidota bacterium]MDP4218226.1 SagB/ThcOx family dehydrogenase [Bacteroidota bacterium]MDP4246330.1 SagB/ThcOx family dehydrogenase [Bacteroidota bacterium]MDP4254750.1 SagB/ThcOx family dehydrogenase [Bacteroidota bacterium]MDP4260552.1 SagB/ThcOx family dehydrogenase [Bacteroidota bacterium]